MYSRSQLRQRIQYSTPSRNGPRLCNSCQRELPCAQASYCSKCCFCKQCTALRTKLRNNSRPRYENLSNHEDVSSLSHIYSLNDQLTDSENELDAAIAALDDSQKRLQQTIEQTKLKRSYATVGLSTSSTKKLKRFLGDNPSSPLPDSENKQPDLSGCSTGDCKCPDGTHPPRSL